MVAIVAAFLLADEIVGMRSHPVTASATARLYDGQPQQYHPTGLKTVLRMGVGADHGVCQAMEDHLSLVLGFEVVAGLVLWGICNTNWMRGDKSKAKYGGKRSTSILDMIRWMYFGVVVVVNVMAVAGVGMFGSGVGQMLGGQHASYITDRSLCWRTDGAVRLAGVEMIAYAGLCALTGVTTLMR